MATGFLLKSVGGRGPGKAGMDESCGLTHHSMSSWKEGNLVRVQKRREDTQQGLMEKNLSKDMDRGKGDKRDGEGT